MENRENVSSELTHPPAANGEHRRDADGTPVDADGTPATLATPASSATVRVDLPITGMTCAACAARVEKVLNRTQGVRQAAVNFATAEARVEYDPQATQVEALIQRVQDAGYGASRPAAEQTMIAPDDATAHRALVRRFWLAA